MNYNDLPTPSLLLDKSRLLVNIKRMQASANRLGVSLRPHLKTMKSAQAAQAMISAGACGITVSTLKEANYFLDHGISDITYAVGIVPSKLADAAELIQRGANLKIMTDSVDIAHAVAEAAQHSDIRFKLLIEIDSGDHRGGLQADSDELLQIASILDQSSAHFQGLLTHGGHSYGVKAREEIEQVAAQERDSVVQAADRLRAAGYEVETISVGSTPTALFATDLTGVTELRAGVYTVFDIDQQSRGICETDEIAMSVLTSVIGHNRAAGKILLDAGGLALSKDRSADGFRPEVGYGQVTDSHGKVIPDLYVTSVSQEHGHVQVRGEADYDLFPVGSQLRILPIHACMTAAAYDYFNVIENGAISERWDRVNGW
ncbi:MAG: D-serine deaminase-like pyridoxal phosphate-dependent protein [Gammaproteobacteria bacterium]|jgi:D-serine deaminase-like pyridoxal phosphate-dependent protein